MFIIIHNPEIARLRGDCSFCLSSTLQEYIIGEAGEAGEDAYIIACKYCFDNLKEAILQSLVE